MPIHVSIIDLNSPTQMPHFPNARSVLVSLTTYALSNNGGQLPMASIPLHEQAEQGWPLRRLQWRGEWASFPKQTGPLAPLASSPSVCFKLFFQVHMNRDIGFLFWIWTQARTRTLPLESVAETEIDHSLEEPAEPEHQAERPPTQVLELFISLQRTMLQKRTMKQLMDRMEVEQWLENSKRPSKLQ